MENNKFLPNKGKYKDLLSYQKSIIIFDCTYAFCHRFLSKSDRTIDQMVQSARSCKQNIVEGAKASVTSSETELKLTNVARGSLEELLEDYHDFLRTRKFELWSKDGEKANYVRRLSAGKIVPPKLKSAVNSNSHDLSALHQAFVHFQETRPSDVCANIMVCLINQCNYLLDQQIHKLEDEFVKNGGLRERMYEARVKYRKGHSS